MNFIQADLGKSRPYIVGLGHQARQGKDTFAKAMLYYGVEYARIYHFADALKSYCRGWRGMKGKDARLLQVVGAAYRQQDPDFWIKILRYQIEEENPSVAIIADVRYENEANWIRSFGGNLIKIQRMISPLEQFLATDRQMDHDSERELSEFDWDLILRIEEGDFECIDRWARDLMKSIPYAARVRS